MRNSVFSRLMIFVVLMIVTRSVLAITSDELTALSSSCAKNNDVGHLRALTVLSSSYAQLSSRKTEYLAQRESAAGAWKLIQDGVDSKNLNQDQQTSVCTIARQFEAGNGFFVKNSDMAIRLGTLYGCQTRKVEQPKGTRNYQKSAAKITGKKIGPWLLKASKYFYGWGGKGVTRGDCTKPEPEYSEVIYKKILEIDAKNIPALTGLAQVRLRGGFAAVDRPDVLREVQEYVGRIDSIVKESTDTSIDEDVAFVKRELALLKEEAALFRQNHTVNFAHGAHLRSAFLTETEGLSGPEDTHVWSDAGGGSSIVSLSSTIPLPKKFMVHLTAFAIDDNQQVSLWSGYDRSLEKVFPLSREMGSRSVIGPFENQTPGEKVLHFMPTTTKQPFSRQKSFVGSSDKRTLGIAFQTLRIQEVD